MDNTSNELSNHQVLQPDNDNHVDVLGNQPVENESTKATAAFDVDPKESKKNLFVKIGVSALALVLAAGVGISSYKALSENDTLKNNPNTNSSSNPVDPVGNEQIKIPQEAQDFVNAYGTRYKDAVATYYAEVAYEQKSGGDSYTIGDDYINTYNFESTVAGVKSPLGFDLLSLSPDAEINVQTSVDQFNNALPTMNRAINLLAKNPTPEQVAVISDEFSLYSGYGKEDYANNLVALFNGIATTYGSNSNYTINPASIETTDSSQATLFDPESATFMNGTDENGNLVSFQNSITLSVSVDTYSSEDQINTSLSTTENLSFVVNRAKNDPFNAGFVAIGTR